MSTLVDRTPLLYPGVPYVAGGGYHWRGQEYEAATRIIGAGVPVDLDNWGMRMAAGYALDHVEELEAMTRQHAERRCAAEAIQIRNAAAKVGKEVHGQIERFLLGDKLWALSEDAEMRFDQFLAFVRAYRPVFEAAEAACFNREYGYAGTLDFLAMFPHLDQPAGPESMWLVDVKATNTIQPRHALQLAALARCDFIAGPDNGEHPMPPLASTAVLQLLPDRFALVRMNADDVAFRTFMHARHTARWHETYSADAIAGSVRPPLVPPAIEDAIAADAVQVPDTKPER